MILTHRLAHRSRGPRSTCVLVLNIFTFAARTAVRELYGKRTDPEEQKSTTRTVPNTLHVFVSLSLPARS